MKIKVLIFGSNGMAGHLISDYLSLNPLYDIIRVARDRINNKTDFIIDVSDFIAVEELISDINPNYVINAIGILNIDAENNPDKAVLMNSYFPHFLAKISEKYNSILIHISTDCVFNGKKGNYVEQDFKDGIGFYAQSKALGEVNYNNHFTLRTSIIGPDLKSKGIGLLNWVLLKKGNINGYSEAYWGGVTTLELSKAIDYIIKNKIPGGLFHLTNSQKISKFKLIEIINEVFHLNLSVISNQDYKVDKSLINTNILAGYNVAPYKVMIEELYIWILQNKDLYNHYNIR